MLIIRGVGNIPCFNLVCRIPGGLTVLPCIGSESQSFLACQSVYRYQLTWDCIECSSSCRKDTVFRAEDEPLRFCEYVYYKRLKLLIRVLNQVRCGREFSQGN